VAGAAGTWCMKHGGHPIDRHDADFAGNQDQARYAERYSDDDFAFFRHAVNFFLRRSGALQAAPMCLP